MKLIEVMTQLDELDDMSYIFIESGRRSEESQVVIVPIELVEIDHIKPPGEMEYFLEVENAKDVVKAWSFMRGGKDPSLQERVIAVLYYAENDAYQPI
jgi:hypothetical protein